MGKWFIAPAHLEGSGCPPYLKPREYAEMEKYGRKITKILRHRYRDKKYNDGATINPEVLASICARQFDWNVSVRGVWQLAQEGQGDGKAGVMVLIATNSDGSIIGWDPKMLGPEPPHNVCAQLRCRQFYDRAGYYSRMKVLGFKCIQGMSGTGGDINLSEHVPHWWNWEQDGYDCPGHMFHGTTYNADYQIQRDKEVRAGIATWRGQWGKLHVYFALKDPLLKILGGRFRQFARITTGNNYNHYPFGKKNEPPKGSVEAVQTYNAWRAAALDVAFYVARQYIVY